jgi:HAD superfamily hydrolase (TIGR01509 family)
MTQVFDALVFDLGNVIVRHDNEVLRQRLVGRCTAPDAPERLNGIAHERRYGTGELTSADLHRRLTDELGYTGDWPTFIEEWSCHLDLDADMLAFVEQLAERYRVLIFSNTNAEHWAHAMAASDGRLGAFEPYLSHEIGDLKPAVSSFNIVAEKAGIDPARSIFFDDVQANVDAARQAGFQAEVFTTKAALENYLREAGAL